MSNSDTRQDGSSVVVRTAGGLLQGTIVEGCARFLGIPYAAAPYGAERLRPPRPAAGWDGVRDATSAGDGAYQPRDPADPLWTYFNPVQQGDDCLNLNVWSPDVGTTGLPVMVWIHGGGYLSGGASAPVHDGRTWARDGVVHVGIGYRLGIDGFLHLDDGTDNLGLRDQVAALHWVQENIAAFGGDPANVTIFGESGGAVSVMTLTAMPAARGLFRRAIAQSGSPLADTSTADAKEVTDRLAELLGIAPTREAFADLSVERTVASTAAIAADWLDVGRWGTRSLSISPFRAVHGTPSLPEAVLPAALRSTVPLLTGTVRNETIGFVQALDPDDRTVADILALIGVADPVVDAYAAARGPMVPAAVLEAAWTDWAFRMPTIALAEGRDAAPTHLYEFRWSSPVFPPGLGSGHAFELPFTQDALDVLQAHGEIGAQILGIDPPRQLAARMHSAWIAYASGGDPGPGWTPYESDARTTMLYDTDSRVASDAAGDERVAWSTTDRISRRSSAS